MRGTYPNTVITSQETEYCNAGLFNKAFLDYVNNYLTVEKFAEDYAMPNDQAVRMIDYERERHNHNTRG